MEDKFKRTGIILKWIWIKLLFLTVILVYILGIFLIIYSFYLYLTGKDTLTNRVLMLTGAITSLSVVYLAEQIRVSGEQEKVKRSNEYFARYNSESYKSITTEAVSFLRDGGKSKDERLDIISNKKNQHYKQIRFVITTYFNFFEEMAILYNRGLLEKELIQSFFKSISSSAFKDGKDCIEKIREDAHSSTNYKEWEKMNEDIEKHRITGDKQLYH